LRIGSAPGTGYDLAGRLVAPYLAKYLPGNPIVIVQNVPGAGSLTLAKPARQHCAEGRHGDRRRDQRHADGAAADPRYRPFRRRQVRLDRQPGAGDPDRPRLGQCACANARRSLQQETDRRRRRAGHRDDRHAARHQCNHGTKFKIVSGYESTGALDLAMERGEFRGRPPTAGRASRRATSPGSPTRRSGSSPSTDSRNTRICPTCLCSVFPPTRPVARPWC